MSRFVTEHTQTAEDARWKYGYTTVDGQFTTSWSQMKSEAEIASDELWLLRQDKLVDSPLSPDEEKLWAVVERDRHLKEAYRKRTSS